VEIRRFVTAEHEDGTVEVRQDVPAPDVADIGRGKVLWGWDEPPVLPIRPDDIGPQLSRTTPFSRQGGVSVNLMVVPPQGGSPGFSDFDMSNSGVVLHEQEPPGTHRTDSVDLLVVIDGEVVLEHPGAADVTLRQGDVVIQNGGYHRWTNHTDKPGVLAAIVYTAERQEG
jgi:hypothetical protein